MFMGARSNSQRLRLIAAAAFLLIFTVFCAFKPACENGAEKYFILFPGDADTGCSVSYAGLKYELSEDRKTLKLTFEFEDREPYSENHGVMLTVKTGESQDVIVLGSQGITRSNESFAECESSLYATNYEPGAVVGAAFTFKFKKQIKESELTAVICFIDSLGRASKAVDFYIEEESVSEEATTEEKEETASNTEPSRAEVTQGSKESVRNSQKSETAAKWKYTPGKYDAEHEKTASEDENQSTGAENPTDSDFGEAPAKNKKGYAVALSSALIAGAAGVSVFGLKKSKIPKASKKSEMTEETTEAEEITEDKKKCQEEPKDPQI